MATKSKDKTFTVKDPNRLKSGAIVAAYYTTYSMSPDSYLEDFLECGCNLDKVAKAAKDFIWRACGVKIPVSKYDVAEKMFFADKAQTDFAIAEMQG